MPHFLELILASQTATKIRPLMACTSELTLSAKNMHEQDGRERGERALGWRYDIAQRSQEYDNTPQVSTSGHGAHMD